MSFTKRAIKEGSVINENVFNDTGMLPAVWKDLWREVCRHGSRGPGGLRSGILALECVTWSYQWEVMRSDFCFGECNW